MSSAKSSKKSFADSPGHQAYLRGDYAKAIEFQMAEVNSLISEGEKPITERKLLGLYFYSAGEYGAAIEILKVVEKLAPKDSEIPENIGIMMRQSGNLKAAIEYLLKAHAMSPEKANVCDGLAHCYGNLHDAENTQKFGRLSLQLKDAAAEKSPNVWPIPDEKPTPFSYDDKKENIIAFSLWGDNPRYLRGALRNAQLAPDLYPGWTCRFYLDDSVPFSTVKELEHLGCEIVKMPEPDPFYEGLLWRFQVIGDPTVKRFLVRDCDSVINVKERVAVDEWLASDKWFHMMRDFISHSEMILAGMWGGVNGALPALAEIRKKFKTNTAPTRTYDQHLLRDMVWPTMRQSVLLHDSAYTGELGSVPFPKVGELGPRQHVGQNEAAIADFAEAAEKRTAKTSGRQPFFVFGLNKSGTTFLQSLIDAHPNANCPSEHHLKTIRDTIDQQISGYRRVIEDFDQKTAQQGVRLNDERMHDVLYRTWVEELMETGAENSTTHVGLNDNLLAESLPRHAELFPDAKFLFIVRDPRDVVVSLWHHRLRNEPDLAENGVTLDKIAPAVAEKWMNDLGEVSKMAGSHRGRIEMIRFEDLISQKRRSATARKMLGFLGLKSNDDTIKAMFEKTDAAKEESSDNQFYRTAGKKSTWSDELSNEQIETIESIAGDMMQKLRYPLAEKSLDRARNQQPASRVESTENDVVLPA